VQDVLRPLSVPRTLPSLCVFCGMECGLPLVVNLLSSASSDARHDQVRKQRKCASLRKTHGPSTSQTVLHRSLALVRVYLTSLGVGHSRGPRLLTFGGFDVANAWRAEAAEVFAFDYCSLVG
jgi:hypothetical protein